MKKIYSIFIFFVLWVNLEAQTFSSFIIGDSADVTTIHLPGLVLAGGGGDNDDAMKWMLERGDGGDVLVIRASGSDGYNPYFYSQLGVGVNSVETIIFHSAEAATDAYVLSRIEEAEVLFMAGGDQYDYYQYWKDNAIEDAINFLLNEKMATVGGTSAGMAILGGAYYAPPGGSAMSEQLLANPFHPNAELLGFQDFLSAPNLPNALITDTHYDQRERPGRHIVFMARLAQEHNVRTYGIACNEYTAVCIDGEGTARAFGEWPEYDDYAYFLSANCQDEFLPEVIEPNTPLTWDRGNAAVKALRLPGTIDGSGSFDVVDWEQLEGGEWFDWHVNQGVFFQTPNADPACDAFVNNTLEGDNGWQVSISPNPVGKTILLNLEGFHETAAPQYEIYSSFGKLLHSGVLALGQNRLEVEGFAAGSYLIKIQLSGKAIVLRFVKI